MGRRIAGRTAEREAALKRLLETRGELTKMEIAREIGMKATEMSQFLKWTKLLLYETDTRPVRIGILRR